MRVSKVFVLRVPADKVNGDIKKYILDKNLYLRDCFYVFHPNEEHGRCLSHYHIILNLFDNVDVFILQDLFNSPEFYIPKCKLKKVLFYMTHCGKYKFYSLFHNEEGAES